MLPHDSSLSLTLDAARAWAGQQHYPAASLYMVATPIGNLADITLRALHTLTLMDVIACEDTRHTGALLKAYGLSKPLVAAHQHNEHEAGAAIVAHLERGERVAYMSDAGTPGVSDPGAVLVAAVRAAGHRVIPLPGASSVTALLSAAGAVTDAGYHFAGFLPTKPKARELVIAQLAQTPEATVLLEAPHRIAASLQALAALGARPVTIGRELTKQFEEIATMPCAQAPAWLAAKRERAQGEFALLLHAQAPQGITGALPEGERVLQLLLPHVPAKLAVKLATDITGAARNALYARALEMRDEAAEDE